MMKAISSLQVAHCCNFVLFGSTGDLALRKILPALYCLWKDGHLEQEMTIFAVGRREWTSSEYCDFAQKSIKENCRIEVDDDELFEFLTCIEYIRQDIAVDERYDVLAAALKQHSQCNCVMHLAIAPDLVSGVIKALGNSGLTGNVRLILEKPFGSDLESAQALNSLLHAYYHEGDIYRIDHYLGKETVKNILAFRFANTMFDPHFNYQWVDHVQITTAETLGMEGRRGGYYEQAGALRDMIQNHMLQLMAFVAMDRPGCMQCGDIRKKKLELLKAIKTPAPGDIAKFVRGQYEGYRSELMVAGDSTTETFAAVRLEIDNIRWHGVPFYLRTGKMLKEKTSKITLVLKKADDQEIPNRIVIRIAPDDGISLEFLAKKPGIGFSIKPVEMDFSYESSFGSATPEAYEHLILDAMLGESTMFISDGEVMESWRIVDAIKQYWQKDNKSPVIYVPGGWGPESSDKIFAEKSESWL